jgi:hypothetical protein
VRGSDFYGIQNIFCSYASVRYRGYFPYAVQHGWQIAATAYESVDAPAEIWVWSDRIRSEMSAFYDLARIRVVGSPYLYLPEIATPKEMRDAGIYVMPHSSHFAKIGFSNSDLIDLLTSLKRCHKDLAVLIYYLDVKRDVCELISRLGVRIVLCGGLWSRAFMHNFRRNVRSCARLYYSSFGSAVLFAQHEGVDVQYVPLYSRVDFSTNIHVNELAGIAAKVQAETEFDFKIELGVEKKLIHSECCELVERGYRSAPIGRAMKKVIANCKNTTFDYLQNLRPALGQIQKFNSCEV